MRGGIPQQKVGGVVRFIVKRRSRMSRWGQGARITDAAGVDNAALFIE